MTTHNNRKAELEKRRAELHQRMIEADAELDSHTSKDWEDSATEREQDEVFEGIGHAAQAEIAQIDAALARLASGEYGHCVKCGTKISDLRLDLLPATPFCKDCAT
ncbi:TraR/DksA family transcriptional regulator [Octadecabacter sp. R77987]|uniref:TraR/DksA family transcriptional regulator n=1 Tax=Octadecabacter sp. R77987 TaxID=3093874 RepID=UPI0036725ADF